MAYYLFPQDSFDSLKSIANTERMLTSQNEDAIENARMKGMADGIEYALRFIEVWKATPGLIRLKWDVD